MSESMSSPQHEAAPQEPSQPCRSRSRCHWKHGVIAGLVLGSLAAVVLLVVCQPQYEATATIWIRAKPEFLVHYPSMPQNEYETFVNTQLVLLRQPQVIDRMLKQPEVARLPIVIQQRDRRDWLTRKLQVKRVGNSEIVQISIKTNSEDASAKIVNLVVDAYFDYIAEFERERHNYLLFGLRAAERRQRQIAQEFQERIRTMTREASNPENAEAERVVDVSFELAQLERANKL